jgi:hypothetical protein
MTSKLKLIIATFLFSIIIVEPVLANSMRCGTHIITAGMRDSPGMYEVMKRCGEPKARYGNTWVYEKSSSVTQWPNLEHRVGTNKIERFFRHPLPA